MKNLFLQILFLSFLFNALAQAPLIKQWDKRLGGTEPDLVTAMLQMPDSGFLSGGYSFSDISGDKTQDNWSSTYADFWVTKTNSLGQKVWDRRFGGIETEALYNMYATSDGNYMLIGSSNSGISGDKTQPAWGSSSDYWIVKIDSAGNKLWDKRYGGNDNDYISSIIEMPDGGFILAGLSYSGVGGDKTQANWGQGDYWVVRINASGTVLWDKRYGGTGFETFGAMIRSSDGNILLGGTSDSGISGDKTENSRGFDDYWIVKIDTLGNKLWDKRFGGNQSDELISMVATSDGGFLTGGNSSSLASPDKSQNNFGGYDYWVLKINSAGIKQWDKIFGGTDKEEQEGTLIKTSDDNYIISGSSYSPISGNKTEANMGFEQAWFVKFDSLSNIIFDKTIFTIGHDEQCKLVQSFDNCYVLVIQSDADTGGYKTEPPWGFYFDYWMVKMCDTSVVSSLHNFTSSGNKIEIYPVPASESISVNLPWVLKSFKVTDASGYVMRNYSLVNNSSLTVDCKFLPNGVYFLVAETADGKPQTAKFIVLK